VLQPGHEFSIEANPDSLTADTVAVLAEHGVNRLSLGVQSFDPRLLAVLERTHRVEHIPRAVELARKRIARISLDLIFAVPGQTVGDWESDLRQALAFEPDHIATYGLTFEKGTRLWKQRRDGQLASLDETTELAMYEAGIDFLAATGFEQYEISNFARPGSRCRHNEVYWANRAYFGVGVGAAAYVEGSRTLNTRDFHGYLQRALAGESTYQQEERLPPRERALETVGTQLRRRDGIYRSNFSEQTGFDLEELLGEPLEAMKEQGLVEDDGARVRLTRRGVAVADAVITELMKA
jgi:oxygen-independent coproporphyrinogen-3 oxidase